MALCALAKYPTYRPFFDKMVEDGLVLNPSTVAMLLEKGGRAFPKLPNQAVIYTLSDPFKLDLSLLKPFIWGINDEGCVLSAWTPRIARTKVGQKVVVYQGELSSQPNALGVLIVVYRTDSRTLRTINAAAARRHTISCRPCS